MGWCQGKPKHFPFPALRRDEKAIGHGNSGFLCDSPPAIWHLHGEKHGGMGLPAKTEIILPSPSVLCLFPVGQVKFAG